MKRSEFFGFIGAAWYHVFLLIQIFSVDSWPFHRRCMLAGILASVLSSWYSLKFWRAYRREVKEETKEKTPPLIVPFFEIWRELRKGGSN